jgi:putative phosphoesterase
MKILFISDIHGIDKNINTIESVIIKKKINKLVCLGDIYNTYCSIKVIDFLNKYKYILLCMRGNCDTDLEEMNFKLHQGLISLSVDGIKMYLNHGHEYRIDKRNGFNGKILIYGHKHVPYIRKVDNIIFICVGSISLPRDEYGSTYMIYENKDFKIFDMDGNIIDEIEI